jgi:hypothetical protein
MPVTDAVRYLPHHRETNLFLVYALLKAFFVSAEPAGRVIVTVVGARDERILSTGGVAVTVLCAGEDCSVGIVIRSWHFRNR